jgi:DNA-binding XRE family transcriptional regulator
LPPERAPACDPPQNPTRQLKRRSNFSLAQFLTRDHILSIARVFARGSGAMIENTKLMPKLRELRHATGATLEQAAGLVEIHPATLSRWERGESQGAEAGAVRELLAWYVKRAEQGAETARQLAGTAA